MLFSQEFPTTRLRRLRSTSWLRNMFSENLITPNDFILPIFVHDKEENLKIPTMPGVERLSIKNAVNYALEAKKLGINAIAIFPSTPSHLKNSKGAESLNKNNLVCIATREIKNACPEMGIICDVALDPYTDHGHDGIINEDAYVLNDQTIEVLCKQALVQAEAGCDIIAPSDMMDGRVKAIRKVLDENNFQNVCIMSYAAKYASAFYGPFRDALGSNTLIGKDKELGFRDKRNYQMNPANSNEALREVALDIKEGADIIMVKPGMPYLDIVSRVKREFEVPVTAYQVSGEYAALKFAALNGALDEKKVVLESLLSFKRAGADAILTYFAVDAAKWLDC